MVQPSPAAFAAASATWKVAVRDIGSNDIT
jgi:hypothetical protein